MYRVPFAEAVASERADQREHWGDDRDDEHSPDTWALIVLRYAGRLGDQLGMGWNVSDIPDDAIAAALTVKDAATALGAVCCALADRMDRRIDFIEAISGDYES